MPQPALGQVPCPLCFARLWASLVEGRSGLAEGTGSFKKSATMDSPALEPLPVPAPGLCLLKTVPSSHKNQWQLHVATDAGHAMEHARHPATGGFCGPHQGSGSRVPLSSLPALKLYGDKKIISMRAELVDYTSLYNA